MAMPPKQIILYVLALPMILLMVGLLDLTGVANFSDPSNYRILSKIVMGILIGWVVGLVGLIKNYYVC
jgi:hypothetical protein